MFGCKLFIFGSQSVVFSHARSIALEAQKNMIMRLYFLLWARHAIQFRVVGEDRVTSHKEAGGYLNLLPRVSLLPMATSRGRETLGGRVWVFGLDCIDKR